jgi:hypothetical protein
VAPAKKGRRWPVDPKINELAKAEYPTKPAIVKVLKSSFAEATAELKKEADTPVAKRADLWVTLTEHSGEHYGQLVVYYRLNGLYRRRHGRRGSRRASVVSHQAKSPVIGRSR